MEVSFTRQQSFTQQELGHLEPAPFDELLRVTHQNFFDCIGVIEQKNTLRADLEINDVTIVTGELGEEGQRVTSNSQENPSRESALRSGRITSHCHITAFRA